jgi:hypothetical protein
MYDHATHEHGSTTRHPLLLLLQARQRWLEDERPLHVPVAPEACRCGLFTRLVRDTPARLAALIGGKRSAAQL